MTVRPARRSTLASDVYDVLKSLVVGNVIPPGERLNIDALARRLEVSPTPVREALARLESDGLVLKRPMTGYSTTPLLTRREFDELFDMRLLLEVPAAGLAAGAPAAVDLVAAAEAIEGAPGATFTEVDARFHDLVAGASGNGLLREAIARLHAHLHLHRLYFPRDDTASTVTEHRRVADAIAAGDSDGAEAAMRAHLLAARARHARAFAAYT